MDKQATKKLRQLVYDSYIDAANDFSRSRKNLSWPETDKLITKTLSTLQQNGQKVAVLDLGCGNGRLLNVLQNYDIAYTGIEQSPALAKHAREKIKRENIAGAKIITDDIIALLTKKNHTSKTMPHTFPLILLIAVLPHIPSRQLRVSVLRGIRSRLAENGRLIITCWNLRQHPKHKRAVRKHAILKLLSKNNMEFGDVVFTGFRSQTPRYYHAYTKRGLRMELQRAGFIIEILYSDNKNIYAIAGK